MHPTISYYLAQARMADLRHDARRAVRARAARRTRPQHREHSGPRLHGLNRRVLPVLGGPAPGRKDFPCQPRFAPPLLSR